MATDNLFTRAVDDWLARFPDGETPSRFDLSNVAVADQLEAATAEADQRAVATALHVMDSAPGSSFNDSKVTPAVNAVVHAAVNLPGTLSCPHVDGISVIYALTGYRILGCQACVQWKPPKAIPDGYCDFCAGLNLDGFHAVMLQAGRVIIVGNVCPTCVAVVSDATGNPVPDGLQD